ncbi:uncharacterized protein G2W53_031677 [Senna tora]|uniref:Uncharacterized protein n=1 Tax=Senna tora TaxID=362788 RepID=A0A834T955_9FABA|nr:uncharacterized protein G2W53_031677 [Senna tora]
MEVELPCRLLKELSHRLVATCLGTNLIREWSE